MVPREGCKCKLPLNLTGSVEGSMAMNITSYKTSSEIKVLSIFKKMVPTKTGLLHLLLQIFHVRSEEFMLTCDICLA